MRHIYIITEGIQDATVAGKVLRFLVPGLSPQSRREEVSSFWGGIIPKSFPSRNTEGEEVFGRVVVPEFYQGPNLSLAVQNSGGLTKLPGVLRGDLEGLDTPPDAIGIIIDADQADVRRLYQDFLRHECLSTLQLSTDPGRIVTGPPKKGVFILPNNKDLGCLEDTMLECALTVFPQLLPLAEGVVGDVRRRLDEDENWLNRDERGEFNKPFGKSKAKASVISAILKPTYAIQNTYRQHNWITKETLELPMLGQFASFLRELIS